MPDGLVVTSVGAMAKIFLLSGSVSSSPSGAEYFSRYGEYGSFLSSDRPAAATAYSLSEPNPPPAGRSASPTSALSVLTFGGQISTTT